MAAIQAEAQHHHGALLRGEVRLIQELPNGGIALRQFTTLHRRKVLAGEHIDQLRGIGFGFDDALQADRDAAQFATQQILNFIERQTQCRRQLL